MFGIGKNEADATIRVKYKGDEAKAGLSSLQKTIASVITVYAVKQVATYAYEMGKLGAQVKLVEKNFEGFSKQAGYTSEQALGKLRKASMGMVTDMELQQKAMQAMIGGVSFDAIITSMEYVSKFALATGQDVSTKMQSTMTGLARGSAQFLDDIGIQVMGSKDVVNDAIAQMKEKMGQFADSEGDAGLNAAKLNAEFQNQKALLGKELIPAWDALTKMLAEKAVPTIGRLLRDLLEMNKTLFTSYTLDDAKTKRIIDLATETGNLTLVQEELNKQLEKQNKLKTEMQAYELAYGNLPASKKVMEDYRKELAETTDQIVKLGMAKKSIESEKTTTPTRPVGNAKKDDSDPFSTWNIDAALEGQRQGFEEKIKLQEEMDKKLAENEQDAIDTRIAMQRELNVILYGEEKTSLDEKLTAYKEYLDAGIILDFEYDELKKQALLTYEEWESKQKDEYRKDQLKKEEEYHKQIIDNAQIMISTADTVSGALMQISDSRTQKEIKNLDKLNLSEKEYNKRKEELEKEAEEKRRQFARVQQGIAIAEATMNAIKMGVGAGADTPGGAVTRGLAVGAAILTGLTQVAVIEAQHFQMGVLGTKKRSRQRDDINAVLGAGETVVPAPQSAANEDALRAIINNTSNTRAGVGGGGMVNNFYGASTEQILNVITQSKRTNSIGMKI